MRGRIFTNAGMELRIDMFMGEYTVFQRLNEYGDEENNYIVAWLPSFDMAHDTVTWAKGLYGMTRDRAYAYVIEKEQGR